MPNAVPEYLPLQTIVEARTFDLAESPHAAEVTISHRALFTMAWCFSDDAQEIKKLGISWEEAHAEARKLVRQNRDAIIAVADRLMAVRRLEYTEALSIVRGISEAHC
jgi:hypothetical protein